MREQRLVFALTWHFA